MAYGPKITCPKCGTANDRHVLWSNRITWHSEHQTCSYARGVDHLHSYCVRCRYDGIQFVFSPRDRKVEGIQP